jgi:hypothetical protein
MGKGVFVSDTNSIPAFLPWYSWVYIKEEYHTILVPK